MTAQSPQDTPTGEAGADRAPAGPAPADPTTAETVAQGGGVAEATEQRSVAAAIEDSRAEGASGENSAPENSDAAREGENNRYKRRGSRYKARRRAVDVLYEAEFRDVDPVGVVEDRVELSKDPENQVKPIAEYTRVIVTGVAENLDAIDAAISAHLAEGWVLDRLPAVERAVLRVSTWELLFNESVPARVATVEGIELVNDYSHVKASAYVNAVLDGIASTQAAPAAPSADEASGPAAP